jgi:hypothetical protein
MFKKFQTGGMMNPQQGQMLPPDPQQMAPQPQGGAQLPPEVMQILMTLPENIRQYLLSLPPDQMMMELQKIMQEQMASQSSPLSQQQGQGQQGPPMPPQGGEQMAPPMMGRYGMKMKAGTGNGKLTTNPYEDALVDKRNKGIITLRNDPNANVQDKTSITTNPKITKPVVTSIAQPTIKSDRPDIGKKIVLDKELGTIIDMGNGKIGFKSDNNGIVKELNIRQNNGISQNNVSTGSVVQNSIPVSNTNQVSVNSAQVPIQNFTTTPSVVTTKPRVTTTKPAQANSSPTTKQQVTTTPITKPKTVTTVSKGVQTNSNNENYNEPNTMINSQVNTNVNPGPKSYDPNSDVDRPKVIVSPQNREKISKQYQSRIESALTKLQNIDKTVYNYRRMMNIGSLPDQNKARNILKGFEKDKKEAQDYYNSLLQQYEDLQDTYVIQKKSKSYKSGGQLPSALKVSTPLKTIMDRKIEMYKSGGKMKLKTCKYGC